MKMEYSIGDIVKLSDKEFYFQTAQFIFPQNLFRIASIEGDKVKLKMLEDEFSCHDIEPVKIDKIEDRDIFYYSSIVYGNTEPAIERDYYIDSLEQTDNIALQEELKILLSGSIKYVHEIQHQLPMIGKGLQIHYHFYPIIHTTAEVRQIADMGKVMSYPNYIKQSLLQMNSTSEQKLFVRKDIQSGVDAVSTVETFKNGYVITFPQALPAEVKYYNFYLNSALGKLQMMPNLNKGLLGGKTNITSIKKTRIFEVKEYSKSCLILQTLIELVTNLDDTIIGENNINLIHNFLIRLRDAVAMEIALPVLFDEAGIAILENWNKEIENAIRASNSKIDMGLGVLHLLFTSLLSTGNKLMINMNRYRLYIETFISYLQKKKYDL